MPGGAAPLNPEAAAAYAERHGLEVLLVVQDGATLFERYAPGVTSDTPHALYSGTKSFWGPLAVLAQADGLLHLDETVGQTFPAWNGGYRKPVTLRHLLSLTSGIGFGGLGNAVPTYARALESELKNEAGTVFTYGGIPLQVFGAVLAAKLAPLGETPHEYLRRRIFEPIGLTVGRWRSLADGTQPLPTGAFLAAAEWARYGRYVLGATGELAPCFAGSSPNPRYGLGWWLDAARPQEDVVYASGSGGQALYVCRSARCVVVKFGRGNAYRHETFLRRLFP